MKEEIISDIDMYLELFNQKKERLASDENVVLESLLGESFFTRFQRQKVTLFFCYMFVGLVLIWVLSDVDVYFEIKFYFVTFFMSIIGIYCFGIVLLTSMRKNKSLKKVIDKEQYLESFMAIERDLCFIKAELMKSDWEFYLNMYKKLKKNVLVIEDNEAGLKLKITDFN